MPDESPRFHVPFSAIKAALDKNLDVVTRESTPTFGEAIANFQGAYARYGGRRSFSRATGIPESTLRRWEKSVAEGKTPKTSEANQKKMTGAVKKVERVLRLNSAREQGMRTNPFVRLQATFTGQEDRGERTIYLHNTTHDKAGFKAATNKLLDAWIRGQKQQMLDAFDDMMEAYEPDLGDDYFGVSGMAALAISS